MFSDNLDNDLEIITYIHDEIIDASGGVKGIHNEGLVRSALARPLQSAGGTDAYATTFEKAAALLSSIANNHGFRDGNKRTAMAAASYYLDLNDIDLDITNEEYETFMLHVVNDKPNVDEISEWLNNHSSKIPATSWKLLDAYKMNQAHADTFHIPSPNDIDELEVGSSVKLGFDITENIEGPRSERMWVLVIELNGNKFTGQLDNDPAIIRGLKYRDTVDFTANNILSIME